MKRIEQDHDGLIPYPEYISKSIHYTCVFVTVHDRDGFGWLIKRHIAIHYIIFYATLETGNLFEPASSIKCQEGSVRILRDV